MGGAGVYDGDLGMQVLERVHEYESWRLGYGGGWGSGCPKATIKSLPRILNLNLPLLLIPYFLSVLVTMINVSPQQRILNM